MDTKKHMDLLIQKFKEHVVDASKNPSFLHHDWFVKYHLNIVERIALELCEKYPVADRNIVLALVWVHDYAKILDKEREHDEALFENGREKMLEIGFPKDFVDKTIGYLTTLERKMEIDLHMAPLEVQIVSSADGASHLIGPFWLIYAKEFNHKSVEELMDDNRKKLKQDWERKIVLPEVKKAFEERNNLANEQVGNFPENYL